MDRDFKINIYFLRWYYEVNETEKVPAKYQRYSVRTYFRIDDEWFLTDIQWKGFIWLESEAFPSMPMDVLPNHSSIATSTGPSFISLYDEWLYPFLEKTIASFPIPQEAIRLRLTSSRGTLKCFFGYLDEFMSKMDQQIAYIHLY